MVQNVESVERCVKVHDTGFEQLIFKICQFLYYTAWNAYRSGGFDELVECFFKIWCVEVWRRLFELGFEFWPRLVKKKKKIQNMLLNSSKKYLKWNNTCWRWITEAACRAAIFSTATRLCWIVNPLVTRAAVNPDCATSSRMITSTGVFSE